MIQAEECPLLGAGQVVESQSLACRIEKLTALGEVVLDRRFYPECLGRRGCVDSEAAGDMQANGCQLDSRICVHSCAWHGGTSL